MASTQPENQKVRLSKTYVDKAACPTEGQTYIRDIELKGFALRLTPGSKSFVVEKRIDGRVRRVTLGRYPALTVEQARKEAHKFLGQIASGANPIAQKENETLQRTTLEQVFQDFLAARKNLKQSTVYGYTGVMTLAFGDWKQKAVARITKDLVAQRHQKLGEEHGEAYANLAMRVLRALFNFAIVQYEDSSGKSLIAENPVVRLTQTRAWYHVGRRQNYLKPHELPALREALEQLDMLGGQAGLVADYLRVLLFTGLRRQEAAQLRWSAVDLQHATLTVEDTKNHEPLTLPLTDYLLTLFQRRHLEANGAEVYVFPGTGATGYLVEPRAQIEKVCEISGLHFTPHDLRRTFITIAESLDISAYALKRLVNHKMRGDVTAGYIITDVERLRAPMQRVTDFLVKSMLQTESSLRK